jgi:hypothetical protein
MSLQSLFNQVIHLQASDPAVQRLLAVTFPDYKGKKFTLEIHEKSGMSLDSYWDHGHKDYFEIVSLADNRTLGVPQNHSGYEKRSHDQKVDLIGENLPAPGIAVVAKNYRGVKIGITIHIHRHDATVYLPLNAEDELSWAEKVVLVATRSYKASYAGVSDYRLQEAQSHVKISTQDFQKARETLKAKKLLNAAGAITIAGKNRIAGTQFHHLKAASPSDAPPPLSRSQLIETETHSPARHRCKAHGYANRHYSSGGRRFGSSSRQEMIETIGTRATLDIRQETVRLLQNQQNHFRTEKAIRLLEPFKTKTRKHKRP